MAKRKSKKFDFGAFLNELESQSIEAVQIDHKEERRYFLIVSEGIRTEPIYFEYWAARLPKNLVNTIDVHGAGDNTIRVVQKALELKERRAKNPALNNYDEVWAVFDKDDFSRQNYNDAIELASREGIFSAHSNQSFELWYVLHFQFLQNALHRDDYIRILTRQLGFTYTKNTPKVVEFLMKHGNLLQAIKWAEELERMHEGISHGDACPSTQVYKLVRSLMKYIEQE